MPEVHAVCAASASHRWIECPPSVRLCETVEEKPSPFAAEGTRAHEWAAWKVSERYRLGLTKPDCDSDDEMQECTSGYADFVAARHRDSGASSVLVETRVHFDRWAPQSFGTADCLLLREGHCEVIDLKYGKGVPVDVRDNPQLKLYALGALQDLDYIWDFQDFTLNIFQPRLGVAESWSISRDDLLAWGESIRPAAQLAFDGKGEFSAGEWCQFCRVKETCRCRAETHQAEALRVFSPVGPELTEDEIGALLPKLDLVIKWAQDLKEHALQKALEGQKYPGFKLVHGRAVRKYVDEAAVAAEVEKLGLDPWEKKVIGVTAMTKLLGGPKKFDSVLGLLVARDAGKPTLVPESDKRPEIS